MKIRILVSQGIGHANHNDGPHYWMGSAHLRGEELREELEDWVCYNWEAELVEKMTIYGVIKVMNPDTGVVGYAYQSRLVIPHLHLSGRTPDRWRLCDFAKITYMK